MAKFIVLQPIWSQQHQKYFQPGDEIELAPNPNVQEGVEPDPSQVFVDFKYLTREGIIAIIPSGKKEVSDGTNSD